MNTITNLCIRTQIKPVVVLLMHSFNSVLLLFSQVVSTLHYCVSIPFSLFFRAARKGRSNSKGMTESRRGNLFARSATKPHHSLKGEANRRITAFSKIPTQELTKYIYYSI
jgi:hypothetical protein